MLVDPRHQYPASAVRWSSTWAASPKLRIPGRIGRGKLVVNLDAIATAERLRRNGAVALRLVTVQAIEVNRVEARKLGDVFVATLLP